MPVVLAGTCALLVAGCGGGSSTAAAPSPSPPPPSYIERDLAPKAIDPQVSAALESHVAIGPVTGSTAVNKLFVFLPGTLGTPSVYKLILQSGAKRGFHTLGLNYVDEQAVGFVCAGNPDPNCYLNVRLAIIKGGTVAGTSISVSTADAIETRLTKAIAYLNTNFPGDGWGRYLVGGSVDWANVVIGGHSQGGGHAGVIAKLRSLSRACYFASPPDWDGAPAAWESLPSQTPASLQFGFAGLSDTAVPYSQLSIIWQTMGLAAFGTAQSVDPPSTFTKSHMLTTNHAPDTSTSDPGAPAHGLPVRDAFTPKNATGDPLFDPVWGYLCFQ